MQNSNKSKTESCTFVKHLIAISISNILYLRKILSANDFDAKVFEGMTIRFLKSKAASPAAETIGRWLNGAFEAVDKKFVSIFYNIFFSSESYNIIIFFFSF